VSAIVNPDKLRHLGPVGDLRALLRASLESGALIQPLLHDTQVGSLPRFGV
jgi:hypothetical protein